MARRSSADLGGAMAIDWRQNDEVKGDVSGKRALRNERRVDGDGGGRRKSEAETFKGKSKKTVKIWRVWFDGFCSGQGGEPIGGGGVAHRRREVVHRRAVAGKASRLDLGKSVKLLGIWFADLG